MREVEYLKQARTDYEEAHRKLLDVRVALRNLLEQPRVRRSYDNTHQNTAEDDVRYAQAYEAAVALLSVDVVFAAASNSRE